MERSKQFFAAVRREALARAARGGLQGSASRFREQHDLFEPLASSKK
jgi:hypothetical protein